MDAENNASLRVIPASTIKCSDVVAGPAFMGGMKWECVIVLTSTNVLESTDGYCGSYAGNSEEEKGFHRGV
jgi:hypothetical protein